MMEIDQRPLVSVVSPVFQAEGIVEALVGQLVGQLETLGTFEIVLVDDRSPDGSWNVIREVCARDRRVRGIRLSRNFGQHRAIRAGIDAARGDFVVVMDCDLQDDPRYIGELLARARDGNEIVYTHKRVRKHSWFRNASARCYFAFYNYLIGDAEAIAQMGVGSYSLLTRKVVLEYRRIPDVHAHYLMNLRSLGFAHTVVEIDHRVRYQGGSSYSLGKLVRHAVNGIVSQSVRLLNLSIGLGLVFCAFSLIGSVALIINFVTRGALAGYTSLMVLLLLFTGLLMLSIGITGLYVGRIFEQVKGRPLYVTDSDTEQVDA